MIIINLNVEHLNVSLQVGDTVYAIGTDTKPGAEDAQQDTLGQYVSTSGVNIVGVLRKITKQGNLIELTIDDTLSSYIVKDNDFIMFSKHDQEGDVNNAQRVITGDVMGYYAQAKFVNNSREKAEIFSVGSEVIINSK
tara:strand:- start:12 stop:425 length:414 start_codon:yes stop_codon:yes gene_type:complete